MSSLFGMEVFAYSVMSNHLHLVLRSRPDRVSQWSDREVAERGRTRLKLLGEVPEPTAEQQRQIEREQKRQSDADWLLDFSDASSPFAGVDIEYYLSLVEWAGRTIRADKPGWIPVDLESVLDRFGVDAQHWAANVEAYGSLFHRIAGKAGHLLDYAQRRGQGWFQGRQGCERLYGGRKQAA